MQYLSHKGLCEGSPDARNSGGFIDGFWWLSGLGTTRPAKTVTIHESPLFYMRRDTGAIQF